MSASPISVGALYRHPIKSTRGHDVSRVSLDGFGVRDDRRMMLIDDKGRFISARTHPQLARVLAVDLPSAGGTSHAGDTSTSWRLEHPDAAALTFTRRLGDALPVEVWKDRFTARRVLAPEAEAWFSRLLGQPLRLVAQAPETSRPLDAQYTASPMQTVFADGYPLLLTSESSLERFNQTLAQDPTSSANAPAHMRRFRPNIVVRGAPPFDEDSWARVEIAGIAFECAKPCERCSLIGVDPQSAKRAPQLLKALAGLRPALTFGINLVHSSLGEIAVGNSLRVLARHPSEPA